MSVWISNEKLRIFASLISPSKMTLFEKKYQTFATVLFRFCLQWKAFDLLYKMKYILCVVALLEVCDVTKHSRYLAFFQELEIR